jgi:hypothetical protein
MKIGVSHDSDGKILTIVLIPESSGGNWAAKYVPHPGERHLELDVPTAYKNEALHELAKRFVVDTRGDAPKLVPKDG